MLTESEKQAVQSDWTMAMKDRRGLGHDIFLTLFDMFPQHQNLFKDFKGLSREQLVASPRLKAHGLRVVGTLDGAIMGLDDMEVTAQSLELIGGSHKPYGLTSKHFEDLVPVMLDVLKRRLGSSNYDKTKAAWEKLLNGVIPIIAKGLA